MAYENADFTRMSRPQIIDVKPASIVDRCTKCGKACCPCDLCVKMKGHRRDICAACFRAEGKKANALASSGTSASPALPSVRPGGVR